MNILYLETRGCNFWDDEPAKTISDVNNYRVWTPTGYIKGKDGNTYFLEFSLWRNKGHYRTKSKRGNKELKHPIFEIDIPYALHIGTQYTKGDGSSWRNSRLETELHKNNYTYTLDNILKATNKISIEQYDKIEFIEDIIKNVIENKGGNREKAIYNNMWKYNITMWNNEHKVITILSKADKDEHRDSFDIDIQNKAICG